MAPRAKVKYYDDPVLVGRRLREIRETSGLSQRELSFPGCTAAYISRIEKGERIPSLQLIREFSVRLGVSEQFISHGIHEPNVPGSTFVEARVAIRLGDLDVARQLANEVLDASRSNVDRARASALFGEIALHSGDADGAIDSLERARLLDPTLEERDPEYAEALGRAYARAEQYESAVSVFTRNCDQARDAGDLVKEVRFSSLLANAYADSSNFAAAEEALARAITLSDQIADPFQQAKALWTQSRLHALQNDSGAAARFAQRALEILEVSDYTVHVGFAHVLLAHIETDRGNPERALELLERSSSAVAASGRKYELALSRIEYARALAASGKTEEAASAAMSAAGSLAGMGGADAGRGYMLIGDVYVTLGDGERALELYELAIVQLETTSNRYAVEAYSKLAELLEQCGDKDGALEVLKRAMGVQQHAERMLTEREAD
ncbi:MAG TPA: tetratricopeptide repeat protein [Gaiellaceae bacterium]|jgi:tetratricopeptide (TPR) repeat protein